MQVDGHDVFFYLKKLSKDLRKSNETMTDGDIAADTVDYIITSFKAVPKTLTKSVFDFNEEKMLEFFSEWGGWDCKICGEMSGDHRDAYRHLATHTQKQITDFEKTCIDCQCNPRLEDSKYCKDCE